MPKMTNIRSRVHQSCTCSRMFIWHGYSVTIDERHLLTIGDCKRVMLHFAKHNIWWLVGKIYGELHQEVLPCVALGKAPVIDPRYLPLPQCVEVPV